MLSQEGLPPGMAIPCPICLLPSEIAVGQVAGRVLLICRQCRHIYWQEAVSAEQIRAYYQHQYAHEQYKIQENNRDYYRSHVRELGVMLGKGESKPIRCIVDFGCSYPILLDEARAMGAKRVVGVDFSARARDAGQQLGVEMWDPQVFCERFDDKADVIRFSHVLEHVPDAAGVLTTAASHPAAGGIAFVTQPIFPVLRARPMSVAFQDAVFPEHLHFFNPISLSLIVNRAGLSIEKFFAFQREEHVQALYEPSADPGYAEQQLSPDIGANVPAVFSPLGGRPTFYGENCRLVARKAPN